MADPQATVEYQPSASGWIATSQHPHVVEHGRTLEKARENIAKSLAKAFKTYPGNVVIDDEVHMTKAVKQAVAKAHRARTAALQAEAASAHATTSAALALQGQGLSLRDIAYVLGISHARVHQIIQKEGA